ncbi:MAG: multicopper oxidase domain-containing protein [Anaeromyxobacter sp.]|nr:multicopper oxidase domain-containing protein [Anaeromyxobacter sp.]
MIAQKRVLSALLGLVFGLIPFQLAAAQSTSGLDQVSADALAAKAATVHQMRANMPSQAQREAAAAELKATKLRLEQARKAAVKAGIMTPEQAQIPVGVAPPAPGGTPDYFTTSNWAFSPELRKFVDALPGLTPAGANLLGNYIPVANPDSITYPGSDYYEIELVEFSHRFHTDLPATTKLRGYHQTNNGTDALGQNTIAPDAQARWLGPVIVATRDRPVRIKFTNRLPIGAGGDLVLPVDESILGSGKGPLWPAGALDPLGVPYAPGAVCDPTPVASIPPGNATPGQNCAKYTQNRSAIHLHGGRTPWISDGTPHQWIIPAGEWANTPYTEGVSLENVPDMPNPGPGSTTYYYSNQQSARLMFYHEHAWGITRLNVIMGVAAGYLITDPFEQALVAQGALPADQIPLVIQDRSFVASDVRTNGDPTWNWGSGTPDQFGVRPVVVGDLWLPHVYVPAQNPYDPTGVNPFGRWVYGPWFFPPTTNILYNTVPNPYHDPNCSDPNPAVFAFCTTPGQPPVIPGTPIPSVGAETFFDTAIVNGQAFPSVTLLPKAYRFRMLNAANDRFQNLNWYKADPAQVARDGRTNTEVKMVPAALTAFNAALYPNWPVDGRVEGVPDPATQGPSWIHFGSEGGFTPRPTVIPPQPITFVTDPTAFNVGNVKDFGLFLGPAERADVVVDFSPYAGQTLILYNDAPAAVPAFDPRHDYLTGAPDLSASGGYGRVPPGSLTGLPEGPQIGFGPNTRTVMQVNVANVAAAPAFDLAALEAAFAPAPGKAGVFETAQDSIIVGQDAYNGIYTGVTFPQVWPYWGFSRIQDVTLPVFTVGGTYQTFPMEPKGLHDEMGASFDMEYGRMAGNLGMTNPNPIVGLLNLTLYDYTDPATEILNNAITPLSPVLGDGTQIWKISHNGVDMHPIHFHIFDVQVINRVGWDGQIRAPHPTELGWKDTVRISPLEDTIVAMRPWAPKLPFSVPNSLRPLNPAIPLNSPFGFTNIDPVTQQAKVPPDVNVVTNFGNEYVWHCHILSHEENDMMRPIILNVVSTIPGTPSPLTLAANAQGLPVLTWNDATPVDYVGQTNFGNPSSEIAFRIETSPAVGVAYTTLAFAPSNTTTFTDTSYLAPAHRHYRVVAYNEGGAATSNPAEFGPLEVTSPATGVTLTAAPPSPYARVMAIPPAVNPPVVFTAAATGGGATNGAGPYEYRFLINRGAGFQVVQEYSPLATYTLSGDAPGGVFDIQVDVRTDSVRPVDISTSIVGYTIVDPAPATVTLSADPLLPSPSFYATPVTFTAVGAGSINYQYRFWLGQNGTFQTAPVQNWSTLATWTMPATQAPGNYQVKVDVRTANPAGDASATVAHSIIYRPLTTLTLVANQASPYTRNIVPVPVAFLATGSGSLNTPSNGYYYRFSVSFNGGAYAVTQPYSLSRVWPMPTITQGGTYTVQVEATTNLANPAPDRIATSTFIVVDAPPATGLTLAASPASPQVPGVPVVFTAAGIGSSGYQYSFFRSANGGPFVEVQPFGAAATWTMPASTPEGNYSVVAHVRASPASPAGEITSAPVLYTLRAFVPATSVAITPSRVSPALAGSPYVPATFSALGSGSTGGYQYRFSVGTNGGPIVLIQDYGVGSSWTMPASTPPGTYVVKVDVRTSPLVDLDASASTTFQLVAPVPASGVSVVATPASPSIPGTSVTFTATGLGSTQGGAPAPQSAYDFRFWVDSGAGYLLVQDFGNGASYTLPTPAAGSYTVAVHVRTSTLVPVDFTGAPFIHVVAAPATAATGVTLAASPTSPSIPGTTVVFTATGLGSTQGGVASPQSAYDFQFWMDSGLGLAMVQNYGGGSTFTLANPVAGSYQVVAYVRTSGAGVADAISAPLNQQVVTPPTPATGVSVVASPASPSIPGASVTFTATGLGSTQGGVAIPQASYAFRFYLNSGAGWVLAQDYGVGASYTLVSPVAGTYQVAVHVRTSNLVAADVFGAPVSHVVAPAPTPATGLSVAVSPASPSSAGTSVTFSATGTGSTQGGVASPQSAYAFQFWLSSGAGFVLVQDYGIGSSYTLPTPAAGTYTLVVNARTSPLVSADVLGAPITHQVVSLPTPATGVSVATSPTSPSVPGASVTFTATGLGSTQGGLASPQTAYQFRFWLNSGAGWVMAQDYGVGAAYTLVAPVAGTYQVAVHVRTSATVAADYYGPAFTHVVAATTTPATGVLVVTSPVSPTAPGTPVTFTATGLGSTQGGVASPQSAYQFRFWVNSGAGWVLAQDYGVAAAYTLPSPVAGTYQVAVHVRTSPTVAADYYGPAFLHVVAVTTTPATGVSVVAAPTSPSAAGVSVAFTATGLGSTQGGVASPQSAYAFRFWVNSGAGWVMAQDYGIGAIYTLPTPVAGTYQVAVHVRTSPTVAADYYGGINTQVVQ